MENLRSFGWYASKISTHLPKDIFKPVPSRLLGGLTHLIIAIAGILSITLFDLHIVLNIVISLVLGSTFASLGFLGHEILHGTVVKIPWLRNFLGAICFWPLSTGPRLWRKWHNSYHHVHTQDEEKDPDAWPTWEKLSKKPFLRFIYKFPFKIRSTFSFLFLTINFSQHSLKCFKTYLKDFDPKNRPAVLAQLLMPWATWIGLLFLIGLKDWIFVYLIPLLIANFIVMAYISTNHRLNPLVPVNDPLANCLTVTVPKWVDAIHFNFSYHTEHHMFPNMSPKHYPLIKEHILKMWPERYHQMSFGNALKLLWATPRPYFDNTELLDPVKNRAYGSLGHGLTPDNVAFRIIKQPNIRKINAQIVRKTKNI